MAKVHFAPFCAIKYVGSKAKELQTSIARPKPVLKKGDIVIVDKRSAFNLVNKGFGDFVSVEKIEFVKSDVQTQEKIQDLKDELDAYKNENNALFNEKVELIKKLDEIGK
jgi:signal peptidase I